MLLIRRLFHFGFNGGGVTALNRVQLKKSLRKLSETRKKTHNFSVIHVYYCTASFSVFQYCIRWSTVRKVHKVLGSFQGPPR